MSKTEAQIENTQAIENPNQTVVELDTPLKRGEISISQITVVKPLTGTLRGLSLQDVLKWEVDAITELLPRITQPAINKQEIANLEVADTVALTVAVTNFLLSAKQKSQQALTM